MAILSRLNCVLYFVLILWVVKTVLASSIYQDEPSYLELMLTKRSNVSARGRHCPIYRNEALYSVVDRICELCFEMFRHQDPNLRAKCRSRCFQNEQFTTCVGIFNPNLDVGVVPVRRRHVRGKYSKEKRRRPRERLSD